MNFWYKRPFEKACRDYPGEIQTRIGETVLQIKSWYRTGQAPVGLGIKKLHQGPGGKVFEARVTLDVRLVWVEQPGEVWFTLVGSHDTVRRFIRAAR